MDSKILFKTIRSEIERLYKAEIPKHDPQCDFSDGYMCGLSAIENFIESLEKEQPQEPKGLAEVADKYLDTQDVAEMFCGDYEGWQIIDAFKAGAEWMANQGETINGSLCYGPHLQKVIAFLEDCPKMWEGRTMDVIVQIRKKKESK